MLLKNYTDPCLDCFHFTNLKQLVIVNNVLSQVFECYMFYYNYQLMLKTKEMLFYINLRFDKYVMLIYTG